MGIEILEAGSVTVTEDASLRVETQPDGERRLFQGPAVVCDDGQYETASMARVAMEIGEAFPKGCTVAMIGGGFCILPRLLWNGYEIAVFERLPALERFCTRWCKFVPGDWRDTLTGSYDVIVYDLGGDVPRETLSKHLNEGGMILP